MRAIAVKAAGSWSDEPADSVVLDYDNRHRRRMSMTGTHEVSFLLDLPEAASLRHGDALELEDGRVIEVLAAPEPLLEIRGVDGLHLARIGWHLGNRHVPTQLFPKYLRIRRDHVIAEMTRQLGAKVIEIEAPFDPEGGAYEGGAHRHDAHDQGHHHHDHADAPRHDH